MSDGSAVEVGVVGREGIAQFTHLLGPGTILTKCFMQVPGSGFRMSFKRFQEQYFGDPAVNSLVLRYAKYQNQILSQLAACNRLHEVEARLARWLLMVQDRIGDADLPLTQEFLSNMLGAGRSTVTVMAGVLQRENVISYHRGSVQLLDRERLERAACECYPLTRDLLDTLYR